MRATSAAARPGSGLEHPSFLPASLLDGPGVDPDAAPDQVAGPSGGRRRRRSVRDWTVDVHFFLLALAVGALALFTMAERPDPPSDELLAFDLLVGVVSCLVLWLRRRWPVGVALVLAVAATFSDTAGGATMIALFTVAVHRRWPVVAAVAGVNVVSLAVYFLLRPDPELPYVVIVPIGLLMVGAVVAWGLFVRARRQLVLSLRERAVRAESEQRLRVEQARQLERTRIAREMHDVLAHRISLLSMHAGALEFRPDASPEEVGRAAGVIRDSAHQALQDLREVIGVLREGPEPFVGQRPQPTLADLPALVQESREAGMRVRTQYRVEDLAAVPAAVGRNAYRIVQEALTNARKHAPDAVVDLAVSGQPGDGLVLEVTNPPAVGTTASSIPGGGTGLVGLVERAHLSGGRLEHGRTADGGFRLRAFLPWSA